MEIRCFYFGRSCGKSLRPSILICVRIAHMIISTLLFSKAFFFLFFFGIIGAKQDHPMVVLIPSHNNNQLFQGVERYKLNLDSVFKQTYENYRILYIDDNSEDGTASRVEHYVKEKGQQHRFTLIRNLQRYGPSRNRYVGAHLCQNHEIVVILDGDDYLAHKNVLNIVNDAYQDPNVWLTYSQFQTVPDNNLSGGQQVPHWVIEENAYRQYGWYYHSLKTFYAGLFKQVELKDLLYEGKFYPVSSDLAEMLPMIELSGGRFKFIPDILYYATQYAHNEMHVFGKSLMAKMSAHILKSEPYKPLAHEFVRESYDANTKADIVILFSNNAKKLEKLLYSLESNILCGQGTITVLYEDIVDDIAAYYSIIKQFTGVKFIRLTQRRLLTQVLKEILQNLPNSYVLFASEKKAINHSVCLADAIYALESTFAYAFCLSLDISDIRAREKKLIHHIQDSHHLSEKVYACQLDNVQSVKNYDQILMTLYRKKDIHEVLNNSIRSKEKLTYEMKAHSVKNRNICLLLEQKKVE